MSRSNHHNAPATEEDRLIEIDDISQEKDTPIKRSLWHCLQRTVHDYWFFGFISFGGPSASVAIFRDHFVVSGKIDEDSFVELFSLSQALPGPSATQLLMAIAIVTQGHSLSGILAFVLYLLPGFITLSLAGIYFHTQSLQDTAHDAFQKYFQGVPPAAVALVCKATFGFGKKLDSLGLALAMISCSVAICITGDVHVPPTSSQVLYPTILLLGAATTVCVEYMKSSTTSSGDMSTNQGHCTNSMTVPVCGSLWTGVACFVAWIMIFIACFLFPTTGTSNSLLEIFQVFFRIGSILFGGGVVIVPMLQAQIIPLGWMSNPQFLAGLGLSQALPGPDSNLGAYCGAVYKGVLGAVVAEVALFAPGCLLLYAVLPFWSSLRERLWFRAVLRGLTSTAIGIIASTCVVLFEISVTRPANAIVFVVCGGLATYYHVPAPAIICIGAGLGSALFLLNLGQIPYHED